MWQMMHKCSPGQDFQEYALMEKWTDDAPKRPLTQVFCPSCKEEFFVLGHELFHEARTMRESQSSRLPPGFVIPRARIAG